MTLNLLFAKHRTKCFENTNFNLSTTRRGGHYHDPCFTNEDIRQSSKWWIHDHGHWWSASRIRVLDHHALPKFGVWRPGFRFQLHHLLTHGQVSKLGQLVLSSLISTKAYMILYKCIHYHITPFKAVFSLLFSLTSSFSSPSVGTLWPLTPIPLFQVDNLVFILLWFLHAHIIIHTHTHIHTHITYRLICLDQSLFYIEGSYLF